MAVWAIADLHLSFGVPDKSMDIFGEAWKGHAEKIAKNWRATVAEEDLVLIAGDLSWAMRLEEAMPDLAWIAALPGTKVIIRGNHDYWWGSLAKVTRALPPSIHAIQHTVFTWGGYSIGGTRLWETRALPFALFERAETREQEAEREKIFARELGRLELSLKSLDPQAEKRIILTHYPPIDTHLAPSPASALLEKYHVDFALFGHLHGLPPELGQFGERGGVRYLLTSADFLDFAPLRIL